MAFVRMWKNSNNSNGLGTLGLVGGTFLSVYEYLIWRKDRRSDPSATLLTEFQVPPGGCSGLLEMRG